jgi:hypothetical protein
MQCSTVSILRRGHDSGAGASIVAKPSPGMARAWLARSLAPLGMTTGHPAPIMVAGRDVGALPDREAVCGEALAGS